MASVFDMQPEKIIGYQAKWGDDCIYELVQPSLPYWAANTGKLITDRTGIMTKIRVTSINHIWRKSAPKGDI